MYKFSISTVHYLNIVLICRCLTDDEKVIQGLLTGDDAPLEVQTGGVGGRGVFATASIKKGSWLCQYKTHSVYPLAEKAAKEEEYVANSEGCYISRGPDWRRRWKGGVCHCQH